MADLAAPLAPAGLAYTQAGTTGGAATFDGAFLSYIQGVEPRRCQPQVPFSATAPA